MFSLIYFINVLEIEDMKQFELPLNVNENFSLKDMFCLGSLLCLKLKYFTGKHIFLYYLSSAFYAWMVFYAKVLITTLFLLERQG